MSTKKDALHKLAQKRKGDKTWDGYYSIADFHDGVYECDYVSPYTKGASNLDASIFVMMQDWSSTDSLKKAVCQDSVKYGRTLGKPSNVNLETLLQIHFGCRLSQTYATNLFPFIKVGPMNARIPHRIMHRAAIEYGLPQIRIIKPKLVICFGLPTFNGLRAAVGLRKVRTVNDGIDEPFMIESARVWLQTHTSPQAQNTRIRHGVNQVAFDWQRMVKSLNVDSAQAFQRFMKAA
ncbi:MAG TPA: hypothetical protein VK557_00255 [Pyrinomonadaceae bacterium]|nr:hypothetical protein [Pyrinomonadaceae bacterium]